MQIGQTSWQSAAWNVWKGQQLEAKECVCSLMFEWQKTDAQEKIATYAPAKASLDKCTILFCVCARPLFLIAFGALLGD